jgi:hypothetical protein
LIYHAFYIGDAKENEFGSEKVQDAAKEKSGIWNLGKLRIDVI